MLIFIPNRATERLTLGLAEVRNCVLAPADQAYQACDNSMGQRTAFVRESLRLIKQAPLLGNGAGASGMATRRPVTACITRTMSICWKRYKMACWGWRCFWAGCGAASERPGSNQQPAATCWLPCSAVIWPATCSTRSCWIPPKGICLWCWPPYLLAPELFGSLNNLNRLIVFWGRRCSPRFQSGLRLIQFGFGEITAHQADAITTDVAARGIEGFTIRQRNPRSLLVKDFLRLAIEFRTFGRDASQPGLLYQPIIGFVAPARSIRAGFDTVAAQQYLGKVIRIAIIGHPAKQRGVMLALTHPGKIFPHS